MKDFIDYRIVRKAELKNTLSEIGEMSSQYKLTPKQAEMIGNLIETRNKIGLSAIKSNIARTTHYNWYNNNVNTEYKRAVDDISFVMKDLHELAISDSAIIDRNPTSLIWYSKTQLKDRGYEDKQDVDMSDIAEMARDMSDKLNKIVLLINKIKDPEITAQINDILGIQQDGD